MRAGIWTSKYHPLNRANITAPLMKFVLGQTGAGKSFTMMGDDSSLRGDPNGFGLIPRICFHLFQYLDSKNLDSKEVLFSHMEIYNECVRDLLAPPSSSQPVSLRVREHPTQGVFVSNLTTLRIHSFEDLMSSIGEKNRTVAATNSNAHSSRSHGIVTLTVIQRYRQSSSNSLPTSGIHQKISYLHLVDLAGEAIIDLIFNEFVANCCPHAQEVSE